MNKAGPLEAVIEQCTEYVKHYSSDHTPQQQSHYQALLESMSRLTPQLLVGDSVLPERGIGVKDIAEGEGLRVTLYYLPEGSRMQLHNHPDMLVMGYMVQGKIQAELYSPTVTPLQFEKETVEWGEGTTCWIDGLRTNRRNLHQFTSLQNAIFLDILFPDYDESDRDCQFYRPVEEIAPSLFRLEEVELQEVQVVDL